MKLFITNYDLSNLKFKLILLYILNVSDIVFTLFLCGTGYYLEANFVMEPIINNEAMSLLVKLIIPAFLLLFLYFRMKSATNPQLKKSNFYVLAILFVYIFINFSHLFWIFYYIYFI